MTMLYTLDLRTCRPGQWREFLTLLPRERQQQALSCRFEPDRARIALAGWLLQYALKQAGIPAPEQHFTRNQHGKPFLADRSAPHFSLSHSGHWVVCAVSDTPVGVDVELPRCSAAVARRYFHPLETAHASDPDQLCRLWTAKEAFVKALGFGITIPLNSFQVTLHDDYADLQQDYTPLPYQLHEYHPDLSRVCLCTVDARPELTMVTVP